MQRFSKVEAFGMRKCDFFTVDGTVEGLGSLLTRPAAGDKTLENGGHVCWPQGIQKSNEKHAIENHLNS
jgi:hypothetical protein